MLRVAVVGAGRWTLAHHLPAFAAAEDVEVVEIVDADPERARAAAAAVGARVVGDPGEVSDVDGVLIATPNATHADLVVRFATRGIGVLVEKPLATTTDDAFRAVRVAESSPAPVLVGYTPLYAPAAAAVGDWVRDGIGELLQVSIEFHSRAGTLYAAHAGDPASAYSAANGGGQATTQLTHAVAALCAATGDEVARVAGFLANRGGDVDVDDACAFVLRSGVSGAAVSTGALGPNQPLTHRVSYTGTRGRVEHDLLRSRARLRRGDVTTTVEPAHLESPYPAGGPVAAFLAALRGDAPPPVTGPRTAAAVVAFTEALSASARSGRVTEVLPVPPVSRRDTP